MIVLDLDDTLLNNHLVVSDENIKALKEAHKSGTVITICSGRVSQSIIQVMKEIGLHTDKDYYISYNGAIINNGQNDRIFYKPIEGQILHEFIEIGRHYGVDIQLYKDDDIIVEKYTPRTKTYEMQSKIKATIVNDLQAYDDTFKVLYNCDDVVVLEKIQELVQKKYQNKVHVFFSKPTYLEIINKEANKGLALAYLADYLQISQDEIIAVGDSMNDVYMIEYAGIGVAVQNARDEVKGIANYITELTNHEHAVAEVINKFILNDSL